MRKIPMAIRIGAIVCIAWFAAAALTPMTSVAIRNSTLDSTIIGGTTPSTGKFTSTQSTSNFGTTVPNGQGGYTSWNTQGSGDEDFINQRGSGVGGWIWYNAGPSGAIGAPVMTLSPNGVLGTTALVGSLGAAGTYPAANGFVNGGWMLWNQTGGAGETDFINQHAVSLGGFSWYDTTSATATGSPIAHLDAGGNLTVNTLTAGAGTITGNLNGNATTATALAANPANCPAGQATTGISETGAPTCTFVAHAGNGTSCTTGSSTFNGCTSTVTWVVPFPDNNYRMTCTIVSPSDARASINGILTKTATGATVGVVTLGSVSVSFAGLDCVAQHN